MLVSRFGTFFVPASGGGSIDTDAQNFLTVAGITDPSITSYTNTLVLAGKSHGWWSKMLGLWPMVGGTAGAHAVNLKSPGTYDVTWAGSPTHSSTGVLFNGTNYGNTNLADSVTPQNDAHISFYSRTNLVEASLEMGTYNGGFGSGLYLLYDFIGGGYYVALNCTQTNEGASNPLGVTTGHQIVTRLSSSIATAHQSGTKLGDYSLTSATPLTDNCLIGAINLGGAPGQFCHKECAFASRGYGLTDAEALAFQQDVQAFQTSLGRQV